MATAQIQHGGQALQASLDEQGRPVIAGRSLDDDAFSWLPPARGPVICTAVNYKQHYAALKEQFSAAPYKVPPAEPFFFIKPKNTITAHRAKVQFPDAAETMVAGAALAVVIGKACFKVEADAAMEHVKGYTLFNDFSLPEVSFFRPPVASKCYDSFGPLGPAVIDKAMIADPHALTITSWINGQLRQQADTADMIRKIPQLIQALSDFMTLPADAVLVTGFPAGRPAVNSGDEVMVQIEGVGSLTNYIVSEEEYYGGDSGA